MAKDKKCLFIALSRAVLIGLISIFIGAEGAPTDDYNDYTNTYNVWSYSFDNKMYEEQYTVKQQDPQQSNVDNVCLSDLHYSNINLSMIASEPLTMFLESLTDVEYIIMIRPLLYRAIKNSRIACSYYKTCNHITDDKFCIPGTLFTLRVKLLLGQVISITKSSIYSEVFNYNALHLWYDMYWSLDTANDSQPLITYDHNFDDEYVMCFHNIPINTILTVHKTMKKMLESGDNDEKDNVLNKIAGQWIKCIDRGYLYSLSLLQRPETRIAKILLSHFTPDTKLVNASLIDKIFGNITTYIKITDNLWVDSFFYNVTTYTKTAAMMEYMLNNIQNSFYAFNSPSKIKDMLNDDKQTMTVSKPMIYSLYLPLILEPYILYMNQIQMDINLFHKEKGLANLTLDITVFNESIPIDYMKDKMARDFFIHQHNTTELINENRFKLGEFVKFATNSVMAGNKTVHYSIFRPSQNYKSYKLDATIINLINSDTPFTPPELTENPAPATQFNPNKILLDNPSSFTGQLKKIAPKTIKSPPYVPTVNDSNIVHLRHIAPKAAETKKILWIIQRASVARRPPNFDIQQLNNLCKTFTGTQSIISHSPIAEYLSQMINLYFRLRYFRPYDFYSEEQHIVKFIKFAYNLHNLRYFTYFQAHMVMYLQYIISTLVDENFKYVQAATAETTAKIQYLTLTCEFAIDQYDITALLINLRTISGGKKLLNRYAGESAMLYKHFMDAIEQKTLDNPSLQIAYQHYQSKTCVDISSIPPEELYSVLKIPYFRIYASLQDPVIFAKIVSDLLLKMK